MLDKLLLLLLVLDECADRKERVQKHDHLLQTLDKFDDEDQLDVFTFTAS